MSSSHPRVAVVTDWLLYMRGSERAFAHVAGCYPDAPIYTTLYRPAGIDPALRERDITTSYLQRFPVSQANFRWLLPLFPRAVEKLSIENVDVVISNTSTFAHRVRGPEGAVHISYCHVPFRHAWSPRAGAGAAPLPLRPAANYALNRIRASDLRASASVDHYFTSSNFTRDRIAEVYGRDATVIYPAVDIERFAAREREDWFLVVGELVPHKQAGTALEAARRAGRRIKVVGDGPERRRLEREYGGDAEFLGRVGDGELASLYSRARAFVMPQVEDFGIVAVEAQASGTPVLAVRAGGACETVVDGTTGILVPPDDVDALTEAMREVDFGRFRAADAQAQAARFSPARFRARFTAEVDRVVGTAA